MTKATLMQRLESGEIIVNSRERVFMLSDFVTVPRRMFDALYDADKLEFVRRHGNFNRAYRLATKEQTP